MRCVTRRVDRRPVPTRPGHSRQERWSSRARALRSGWASTPWKGPRWTVAVRGVRLSGVLGAITRARTGPGRPREPVSMQREWDVTEPRSAAEEARDPSTTPERLLELTEKHPQLQKLIVLNPSCPEVARQWILATNPWAKAAFEESSSGAAEAPRAETSDETREDESPARSREDESPGESDESDEGGDAEEPRDSGEEPDESDEPDEVSVWGDFSEDGLWGEASQPADGAGSHATHRADGTSSTGGSGPVRVRVAEDRGVVPLGPVNPSTSPSNASPSSISPSAVSPSSASPSSASPSTVGPAGAGAAAAGAAAGGADRAAGSPAAPASPPAAQAPPETAPLTSGSASTGPALSGPAPTGPAQSGQVSPGPVSPPAPSPSTASAPPSAGPAAAAPGLGAASWQGSASQPQHPVEPTPTAAYGLPAFSGPAAAQHGAGSPPPPAGSETPEDTDPSRRRLWFAGGCCLLLAIVLLIAGGFGARALLAGDDDEYQRDSSPSAEAAPSSAPEEAPTTTEEETPSKEPVSPAPDGAHEMTELRSPSGNITCQLEKDTVACSIVERGFTGAGLEDCSDGPFSMKVSKGTAVRACGSSYLSDTAETLEYEESAKHGNTACTSRSEGMTCWNTDTGHGFSVNRASYETF